MGGSLPDLSDKEAILLTQVLASPPLISQRGLAQNTGFSIGLINSVLKKLIRRGFVKAKAINKKKMRYLLTRHGSVQIMKRSYFSITGTIRHYQQMEAKIESLLSDLTKNGSQNFYLHGKGELAKIVERVLKKKIGRRAQLVGEPNGRPDVVILNSTGSPFHGKGKIVNLTEHLRHY